MLILSLILLFAGITGYANGDTYATCGTPPPLEHKGDSNICLSNKSGFKGDCIYRLIDKASEGVCKTLPPNFINSVASFASFDDSLCCTFFTDGTCGTTGCWTTDSLSKSVSDMGGSCRNSNVTGHLASYKCGKCGTGYHGAMADPACGTCIYRADAMGPCGKHDPLFDSDTFYSRKCKTMDRRCGYFRPYN